MRTIFSNRSDSTFHQHLTQFVSVLSPTEPDKTDVDEKPAHEEQKQFHLEIRFRPPGLSVLGQSVENEQPVGEVEGQKGPTAPIWGPSCSGLVLLC